MKYNVLITDKGQYEFVTSEGNGIKFYAVDEKQLETLIKLTTDHDYEISITKAYEE